MADVAGTWVAARINSSTSVGEVGVGLQCGVKSLKAKHGMYDLASRAEGVSAKGRWRLFCAGRLSRPITGSPFVKSNKND